MPAQRPTACRLTALLRTVRNLSVSVRRGISPRRSREPPHVRQLWRVPAVCVFAAHVSVACPATVCTTVACVSAAHESVIRVAAKCVTVAHVTAVHVPVLRRTAVCISVPARRGGALLCRFCGIYIFLRRCPAAAVLCASLRSIAAVLRRFNRSLISARGGSRIPPRKSLRVLIPARGRGRGISLL